MKEILPYTHPYITSADAEGAGEMFKVTTFGMDQVLDLHGKIDYTKILLKNLT